jgi:hypothetical protein
MDCHELNWIMGSSIMTSLKYAIAFIVSLIIATPLFAASTIAPQPVNVRSFGAIGDSSSHPLSSVYASLAAAQAVFPFVDDLTPELDWASIQSAIDFCGNNWFYQGVGHNGGCREIYCPAGAYYVNLPLFFDLPNNLRGTAAKWSSATTYNSGDIVKWNGVPWVSQTNSNTNNTPSPSSSFWLSTAVNNLNNLNSNWGGSFIGDEGLSGGANLPGCYLQSPNQPTYAVLWVGPMNGSLIKNVNIQGDGSKYKCQFPTNSIGIAYSGGGSRSKLENSQIVNMGRGVVYSANGISATNDSNSMEKMVIGNTCIGVQYNATQNFINDIIHSNICGGKAAVDTTLGVGVRISGGNWSCGGGAPHNTFSVSSISASQANPGTITATMTIGSPDSYLTAANCATDAGSCTYGTWNIVTAHYGVLPLQLSSYNQSSHVASFQVPSRWLGRFQNTCCAADLLTEIQAVTQIYAAEYVTTFSGCGMTIDDVHMEQMVPTQLIRSNCTFGGQRQNFIHNMYFNYNVSDAGAATEIFYGQQNFPFIYIGTSDLVVDGVNSEPFFGETLVEYGSSSEISGGRLIWRGRTLPLNALFTNTPPNSDQFTSGYNKMVASTGLLVGEFDGADGGNAYAAQAQNFSDIWRSYTWGKSPFWGVRPAPWSTPCLTPSQITTLTGSLPAINTGQVTYPLMWGGQEYRKCDYNLGSQTTYHLVSTHFGYTYGQNLTTSVIPGLSWGQHQFSPVLYISSSSGAYAATQMLFPGLTIGLKCGGAGSTNWFIITGIYVNLGYVTITPAPPSATDTGPYIPNLGSLDCSDSTIYQQAFAITQY